MSDECLTVEMLAVFLEGKLTFEERKSAESHLAECARCREIVANALRAKELLNGSRPQED